MGEMKTTEGDLLAMLRERFKAPEFAFLSHVRNGTGYQRTTRTADALAMSLWPSRGLHLHGFEVKVSRSDWLREKDLPEKAEEIARFCQCWWLVVADPAIVQPGELPPTWGLLVPKGSKLRVIQEAPVREAQAPTHLFLAALLRRTAETFAEKIEPAEVEREVAKRLEAGKASFLAEERSARDEIERRFEWLKKDVATFEEASGVKLDRWNGGRIGEAVRIVLAGENVERRRHDAERTAEKLERAAMEIRAALEEAPHAAA